LGLVSSPGWLQVVELETFDLRKHFAVAINESMET